MSPRRIGSEKGRDVPSTVLVTSVHAIVLFVLTSTLLLILVTQCGNRGRDACFLKALP
jgi:hypothetical protein